jgi:chromosome segregation ATPase
MMAMFRFTYFHTMIPDVVQESTGLVGATTADASLRAYFGCFSALQSENESLRLECKQLQADISSVRRDQRKILRSLKQVDAVLQNVVNTDDESEGDGGESMMQVAAITSPAVNPSVEKNIAKFAAYLQEVNDQTTDLRRQRAQLRLELVRRQAKLVKLKQDYDSWKAEFDKIMNWHKQLTETALDS